MELPTRVCVGTTWQLSPFHLTPFLAHSLFSEIGGLDGSLNSEMLDLRKRIGDIRSLEQLSTIKRVTQGFLWLQRDHRAP